MRIGLVGVGRIGLSHGQALAAHPDVTELVVCDADLSRAREVAGKLDAAVAETADEVFDGTAGVVVAAPTTEHEHLVRRGVRAGVPLLCEKPLAPDVEGTMRVVDEVRRAGVPVLVGFQRRFDLGYQAARRALRDGQLGVLHRVHMVTADPEPPPAGYIASSGGIFRDCHVHDFDILRWVTGREVVEVYATGSNRGAAFFTDAGDVDNSAALLRLDDDTVVTVAGSRYNGGGYDVRMELAGDQVTVVVGLDQHAALVSAESGETFPSGQPWPGFWPRFADAYQAELRAFVALAGGAAPADAAIACTVDEALQALYVAEAADLSRRERRPVAVDEVRQ